MPPFKVPIVSELSDTDLDAVAAGAGVSVSVTTPSVTVAPTVAVQTNLAALVSTNLFSSGSGNQIVQQVIHIS